MPPVERCTFGELSIQYDERVLVPRAWTVAQSDWASELSSHLPDGPILELCTGVGHIGLLAARRSGRDAVLVDRDPVACFHARENVAAAGLADRVEVRQDDLDSAITPGEQFVLAVVDPPWVPSARTDAFPEDPLGAIDGGPDGLALARSCLRVVEHAVHPDGVTVLQIGDLVQVDALRAWLEDPATPDLTIDEVRPHPRGVLVLVRRRSTLR